LIPQKKLAALAKKKSVNIIPEFFSLEIAKSILKENGKFDAIVALNVVPHTEEFIDLLAGVELLLADDAPFVLEFAYVIETILKGGFDTIYHEHIYNFSMRSIAHALDSVGMVPMEVLKIPTQGGSLRVVARKKARNRISGKSVLDLLTDEDHLGVANKATYFSVKKNIEEFRTKLVSILEKFHSQGRKIIALGAPARGTVVLNYCKLNKNLIEFSIDDTTFKQGKLVPGVHIPVHDWSALENGDGNEVFLLVSWNYKQEILKKLFQYRSKITLIEYFPEIQVSEMSMQKKQ